MKFKDIQLPTWASEAYFKNYNARPNEPLFEHFIATREYFLKLCDGGLEDLIDRQIKAGFESADTEKASRERDTIKKLIIDMITFHDIGKINPAFQKGRIGNTAFLGYSDTDTTHSEFGWILFSLINWQDIMSISEDNFFKTLILTTVIAGHHTFAWGAVRKDKLPEMGNKVEQALSFSKIIKLSLNERKDDFKYQWSLFSDHYSQDLHSQQLFSLYKTIYSALILSDANAVSEKEHGTPASENTVNPADVGVWRKAFSESEHLGYIRSNAKRLDDTEPEELISLNDLRSKIFLEVDKNFKNGLERGERIFYLESPTGSGKTNCAINLMLTALEKNQTLKRAFFVFPFINLIEQNVDVIKKSISAQPGDVLEVHSLSEWNSREDDEFRREYDERLFLNGKISVTSSVNFFEALGSSRKTSNYKICNLSNSVVIVDELQSVDDKLWTYFQFLLESFAKSNNCYIILMSATLPKIDKINVQLDHDTNIAFVELLPDVRKYQLHPCFADRTKIIFKEEVQCVSHLINLAKEVLKYSVHPTKALIVVNTVKRSKEIFEKMPTTFETINGHRKFKKYLLNSELLPHKKREIIEKIDKQSKNTEDLLLISTQCIEAGIDADFDVGIRDCAIPDSIEQVAGRVNREGKKSSNGVLYVANLHESEKSDAEKIYGGSHRWETCKHIDWKAIVNNRYYSEYYDELIKLIKSKNSLPNSWDVEGRSQKESALKLRLFELKDFQAIKDDNQRNFFIPTDLPKCTFSDAELHLIPKAVTGETVSGEAVWNIWEGRTKEKSEKFLERIKFYQILSKFIAKTHKQDRPIEPLRKLEDWDYYYDIESGFKDSENIF